MPKISFPLFLNRWKKNLQATVLIETHTKITLGSIHLITVLVNTFDEVCIQYGTARKKTSPDDL